LRSLRHTRFTLFPYTTLFRSLIMYGDETLGVSLPNTVTLLVEETEPGIKGDTASGGSKPAKMETGLMVNVPFFVNAGDKLVVNTDRKSTRLNSSHVSISYAVF